MRWYRKIRVLLGLTTLVVIVTACAAPPTSVERQRTSWVGAQDVIAFGYRGINQKYIEPLTVEKIGLDGLSGLATIDPEIRIKKQSTHVLLLYSGKIVYSAPAPDSNSSEDWAKLTVEMATQARRHSTDMRSANSEQLYEAVFDGALSHLDIFSRYAGTVDARQNRARRDGFGGIGINFQHNNGVIRITQVSPKSPAENSGILVGDIMTHINGKATSGLTVPQVTSKIHGLVHTTLALTISRDRYLPPQEHNLIRTHIVPTTVTEERLNHVLYLKVSSFNKDTAKSLSDKLEAAVVSMGNKFKGVVIDLRGNPGGLLKQSVKMADLFLTHGNIISTKGRHADSLHNYNAGGRDVIGGLPILMLIDGKSASAAEIVAAALQDRERAVLIGTSSYGKGTVQTVLRLPNDGEITLTWSRLIAPSGYILHGLGVHPSLCTRAEPLPISKWVDTTIEKMMGAKSTFNQWRTPELEDEERRTDLRNTCPAQRRSSDMELEVAKHVIENPKIYARALSISSTSDQAQK